MVWLCLGIGLTGCGQAAPPQPTEHRQASWPEAPLEKSYAYFKRRYIENGERVPSQTFGGVVSEGQAYAMLMAVWMNDRTQFEQVWTWTAANMMTSKSFLPAWHWGERDDKSTGILKPENATDADEDMAFAMALAAKQWQHERYTQIAQEMIRDLWKHHVIEADGRYFLSPGAYFLEHAQRYNAPEIILNPSYFAPAAYRVFAELDPEHPWPALITEGYRQLEACSALTPYKLPPDWCAYNLQTHQYQWALSFGDDRKPFGYEAFRVFYRLTLDEALTQSGGTGAARTYLRGHPGLLSIYQRHKRLPEKVLPDGSLTPSDSTGFLQAALLAQQQVLSPNRQAGEALYNTLLGHAFKPHGVWFHDDNYYRQATIWLHLKAISLLLARQEQAIQAQPPKKNQK